MAITIHLSTDTGGYDYSCVDIPPDRLVCRICHFTSRDPHLSVCCGHTFCSSCLANAKKANILICPVCRDEEFVSVPNKQVGREIRSLHVMCTNKERGCEWQGELNDINNHFGSSNGCQFEDVKCSNECGKMLQRQYLTSHVEIECPCRNVDCQYCHITGEHQFIEGEHKEQCPKVFLSCPNKCGIGSLLREDMEVHRKECPLEMIQCEYHNVGCEERMMRKRKKKHEQQKMKEHLSLAKRTLTETKLQLDSALEIVTLLNHGPQEHCCSDTASTISAVKWWASLTTRTRVMKSGGEVCPVILNVTDFNKHKLDQIEWCSYHFYTHDKGYQIFVSIYPDGFEDAEGTHLSMFLNLMKGPYDDELTFPLMGKFEVKLLNQISDCEHYSVTVTYDDSTADIAGRVPDNDGVACGWGETEFISNEDFHNVTPTCQYLKDDCIFLQVSKL